VLLAEKADQVPWEAVLGKSQATKNYWQQWHRLRVMEGKLYRSWMSVNGCHERWQFVPPPELRKSLLLEAHTGLTGGHLGSHKTREQLQRRAYWHSWSTDVSRFCQCCTECSRYLRGMPKKRGLLQVTKVGDIYDRVSIDLTGPHVTSKSGNVYILTILDHFSKHCEAIPLRNKEAITVARALFDVVFTRYGFPLQLLSDQGLEFENGLLKELCRLTGIEKLRTTAYKPSTNGAVERFHRTLNSMLAKVVREDQRDWDVKLQSVMAAYRASAHESTGFSPNFLMFGRENRAPIDLLYGGPPDEPKEVTCLEGYAAEKVEDMKKAYQLVREHLGAGGLRMKKYYDMRVRPQVFKEGQWVYYYNPRRYVGRSPKWQKMYTGPFLIVRTLDSVNVVLQASKRAKPFVCHVDKVKLCLGDTPRSWLSGEEETLVPRPVGVPLETVEAEVQPTEAVIGSGKGYGEFHRDEPTEQNFEVSPSFAVGDVAEPVRVESIASSPNKRTRETRHRRPPQRLIAAM
jgi:transposase InsO family protein